MLAINILLYLLLTGAKMNWPLYKKIIDVIIYLNMALSFVCLYEMRSKIFNWIKSPQFFKTVTYTIRISIIAGILAIFNYLLYQHPKQVDFTRNQQNTLSEQTRRILKRVSSKLTIKIFSHKESAASFKSLLELYRIENSNINYSWVDVEARPDLVSQHQVTKVPTITLEYHGKKQKIIGRDELEVTNGILKLLQTKEIIVYATTGHNELSLKNKGKDGLSLFRSLSSNALIDIREIDLRSVQKIPENASAVMIWGPRLDFHKDELKILTSYLTKHGNLLVAMAPQLGMNKKRADLYHFLEKFEIKYHNNFVVDSMSNLKGTGGSVPLIKRFDKKHPVSANISGGVFFPFVSSIQFLGGDNPKGSFTKLALTSPFPASWGETSAQEVKSSKVKFSKESDLPGPMTVAASWEEIRLKTNQKRARIILFGNSSFIVNGYHKAGNNFSFLLSCLNWLVHQDHAVAFDLPVVDNIGLVLTSSQADLIFYIIVFLMPLSLFSLAGHQYKRRKST